MSKRTWVKHGFWNFTEHGLTRALDAITSLLLVSLLAPEVFARLALAQAWIAPALFLFISTESVLYRDYSKWQAEGPSRLRARVEALRLFSWLKFFPALLISLVLVQLTSANFFELFWALTLALIPQYAGADRDFLRLSLQFRKLNIVTLFQKISLLLGTIAAIKLFHAQSWAFALAASISAALQTGLSFYFTQKNWSQPKDMSLKPWPVVWESIRTFSIWNHLLGVTVTWVQTMDLFILGLFGMPQRMIGLYGSVLKLSNLTAILPNSINSLFSIWLGRKKRDTGELRQSIVFSSYFTVLNTIVSGVILFIAPWGLALLSRGRWLPTEQNMMHQWMIWIVLGLIPLQSIQLLFGYLTLREKLPPLIPRVILPWGLLSFAAYAWSGRSGNVLLVAKMNLFAGLSYCALVVLELMRVARTKTPA